MSDRDFERISNIIVTWGYHEHSCVRDVPEDYCLWATQKLHNTIWGEIFLIELGRRYNRKFSDMTNRTCDNIFIELAEKISLGDPRNKKTQGLRIRDLPTRKF